MLGVAQKITGAATKIVFRGAGKARFRLQHARDWHNAPDDLSWCEVSQVNNGALRDPVAVIDAYKIVAGGVLVDMVEGDTTVIYRRHNAGWLRVVPFVGAANEENWSEQCAAYSITMEPVT